MGRDRTTRRRLLPGDREGGCPSPVFLDVRVRRRLETDQAGLELPSADEAYVAACAAIPGLAVDRLGAGGGRRDEPSWPRRRRGACYSRSSSPGCPIGVPRGGARNRRHVASPTITRVRRPVRIRPDGGPTITGVALPLPPRVADPAQIPRRLPPRIRNSQGRDIKTETPRRRNSRRTCSLTASRKGASASFRSRVSVACPSKERSAAQRRRIMSSVDWLAIVGASTVRLGSAPYLCVPPTRVRNVDADEGIVGAASTRRAPGSRKHVR